MMILLAIFFFTLGIILGSFSNVLIDRLATGRPISNSRSVCDSCHKQLRWYELIPLVSYVIQGGKCRNCSARIPFRIFFVELLTGLIFAGIYFVYSSTLSLLFILLMMAAAICLIVIFFTDWQYGIIPDQMLILLGIIGILLVLPLGVGSIVNHIVSGVVAFVIFFALFWLTHQQGIGFGDVKFALAIGFLLGFPGTLAAIYFGFLTGGLISLILIIIRKKKFRKDTIAFGPFLVIGIVLFLVFQEAILQYLHTFGL